MDNLEGSVPVSGWLTGMWSFAQRAAPYQPKQEQIKALAESILRASSAAHIPPQEQLLASIKALQDEIKPFEDAQRLDFTSRCTNLVGITEISPARYSELQKIFVNYLALCEAEIGRLVAQREFSSAIAMLQALKPIVPDPTAICMRIARAYELQGDHLRAIAEYESVATALSQEVPQQRTSLASCWAAIGQNFLALNDIPKAYASFCSAVNADYSVSSHHYDLIALLLHPMLLQEGGFEYIISYVNSLLDAVKTGDYSFPTDVFQFLIRSLQQKYEETGISEFQGIAARTLRRVGEILIHQKKLELALDIARFSFSTLRFPDSHPLHEMDKTISERSAQHPLQTLGAYFSSLGSTEVKGGVIRARSRIVDGEQRIVVDCKLTHVARAAVQQRLALFEQHASQIQGITISDGSYTYRRVLADGTFSDDPQAGYSMGMAKRILFPGIGSITIGADPRYGAVYNRIEVEMAGGLPPGEGLRALLYMFSYIGLPSVLTAQSAWDDRKLQIFQIFHTFFPQHAFELERDHAFVEMTCNSLLATMITKVPASKALFEKYLSGGRMEKQEILPGCPTWHITDLAEQMRAAGAWGFMSGIGLPGGSIEEDAARACLMLQNGVLSTQCRFDAGLIVPGASAKEDHMKGSADCVFTRLVTPSVSTKPISVIPLSGTIQVLYDLSLSNRGGYAYLQDEYGVRNPLDPEGDKYRTRPSVITTAQEVGSAGYEGNEFMFKFAIMPSFITSLVVASKADEEILIRKLNEKGMIVERAGRLYIKTRFIERPIDEFIHISSHFTQHMWRHQ